MMMKKTKEMFKTINRWEIELMASLDNKTKRQKRLQQKKQNKKNKQNNCKKFEKNKRSKTLKELSPSSSRSILKKEHRRLGQSYFGFSPKKSRKKLWCFLIGLTPLMAGASSIIPTNNDINHLYYQIGGGSDYRLPVAPYSIPIDLSVQANLGLGNQCGMYNPAISISNTLNDLEDSVNNLTESLIANATGSLAEMPMYFLALANPTLYNLLNNSLISAHTSINASVKSCQETKNQIAQGKNPYEDWATLSIGNSWKSHLSLTAMGDEDINAANEEITQNAGNDGVVWVQGKTFSDGSLHAAGKNQPPVHVITDTTKAGYNALLNRDLTSDQPAPTSSDLANQFPTPTDATSWITGVLGDQNITTCTDSGCKAGQGTVAGRGLLPWMTICTPQNNNDCVDTINQRLQALVSGSATLSKDNLLAVSANDLVISPTAIHAIQNMDASQQGIVTHKLAQEVALQRLMEKALMARDILQTGRQTPPIAVNRPAQFILQDKMTVLDNELRSLSFEAQVRKQMMSDTLLNILNYSNSQQGQAFGVGQINNAQPLMENGAIPTHPQGGH
jgi:integrating conjugative element protein (TIGR03755 family)